MPHIPHAFRSLSDGDLVFERPPLEGLYEDGYRALRTDLEAQGWKVSEVASFEQRGLAQETIEIAFRLLRDVGDEGYRDALALLVGVIFGRLRRPKRAGAPKRTATIYGPRLEVLARVELDEPEHDALAAR